MWRGDQCPFIIIVHIFPNGRRLLAVLPCMCFTSREAHKVSHWVEPEKPCHIRWALLNTFFYNLWWPAYFSLALGLGQVDLFKHLRSLFHHEGLLVGVGRDVTIMLRGRKRLRGFLVPSTLKSNLSSAARRLTISTTSTMASMRRW